MDDLKPKPEAELPSLLDQVQARTPARILTGRFGGSYATRTWLELRADHAAARDAVRDEIDLEADRLQLFLDEFVHRQRLHLAGTRGRDADLDCAWQAARRLQQSLGLLGIIVIDHGLAVPGLRVDQRLSRGDRHAL